MHGQREIMAHNWNLVGFRRLFDEGSRASAHGAFKILKDHDCDLRPFWWTKNGVHCVLRSRAKARGNKENSMSATMLQTDSGACFS